MITQEAEKMLFEGASRLGIKLDSHMLDAFGKYKALLLEWNEKVNLTSITDEKEIVIKHFLDSLSIIPHIPDKSASLADIGTGAGFPGIAVKIAKSCGKLLLVDSLDKRIKFLEHTISELELESSAVLHARAEDAGHEPGIREAYDCVTARAVAGLNVLLEYCLPFVKTGGIFIAMKGKDPKEECEEAKKALDVLGGEIVNIFEFLLPFSDISRSLVIIRKFRHIPTGYPRKAGKPSKLPLK
jgi:16S rRNA (guanine527-N7)-methyltransferase